MAKNNYIRFDWAIKRLLRNKADYTVLEGFLSVLLNDGIKIKNIKESESNKAISDATDLPTHQIQKILNSMKQ